MKNVLIIIVVICAIIVSYGIGKNNAYKENAQLLEDFYELSLHSEEILDMYYEHDSNYYLDVISETDSYQEYYKLRIKLLNE